MTIGELVANASSVYGHSEEDKRAYAVAAALEVIGQKASQSGAHITHLDKEFERLSTYADQIQAALKLK
ncbi:hypothetical protein ACI2KG_00550 [Pseudomonas sp. NPDC089407]|uniref:hypothetical protein n=1 Tax=Pseudomonas sp. NPDC089407 TaxID=3364464 RepID=UPI00385076E5